MEPYNNVGLFMKANEFIKRNGWEKAEEVCNYCCFIGAREEKEFPYDGFILNIPELCLILMDRDIVMEHGSISKAKSYANSRYTAPEVKDSLLKIIANVESCQ